MELVDKALRDPRAKALFEELFPRVKFHFQPSDNANWGSNVTVDNVAEISVAATTAPESALAHELLHIRLQLSGYRRLRLDASLSETPAFRARLQKALDNELQHHRMFPEFVGRGFPSTHFYADDDVGVEKYLREELAVSRTYRDLVVPFLTLIAPGGRLRSSAKRKLMQDFLATAASAELQEVKAGFVSWCAQTDLNAEPLIRKIYCLADPQSRTWIGYGRDQSDFPGNGFFVADPFTL